MSQPESAIAWVLRILPSCNIPPHVATWNEINMKISELKRIQNQDLSTSSMYCPWPGCTYHCKAPEEMDSTDTILCPTHSTPMALMTWKQLAEKGSLTMLKMQEHIEHIESLLQTHQEQLRTLSAQTLQAARLMKDAQDERREIETRLEDFQFATENEKDRLEYLEWIFAGPAYQYAQMIMEEIRRNSHKGNWDEWKPDLNTLKSEIGHHFKKLCGAMQQRNRYATDEFSADIGAFMLKAIELYGTPA